MEGGSRNYSGRFQYCGGLTHSWGEPTDMKIGPCSSRSVSVNNFIYVLAIEKLWVLICCVCAELRTEEDLKCNVECVPVSVILIVRLQGSMEDDCE